MNDEAQASGQALAQPRGSALSSRDKAIWRAALTLAHNMCVQDSDRINDEDGSLHAVHALSDEAKRIRGWMEPTDEQLMELLAEAGVPNHQVRHAGPGSQND